MYHVALRAKNLVTALKICVEIRPLVKLSVMFGNDQKVQIFARGDKPFIPFIFSVSLYCYYNLCSSDIRHPSIDLLRTTY